MSKQDIKTVERGLYGYIPQDVQVAVQQLIKDRDMLEHAMKMVVEEPDNRANITLAEQVLEAVQ
jgi:predicted DNA binding CopG/RHH family protein